MLFPSVSIPIRSHCKHNNGGEKRGLSPTLAMNILWSSQPLPHIKPQSVQAADCGFYPMWVFFSVQELPVLSLSLHALCSSLATSLSVGPHPHPLKLKFLLHYDFSCNLCGKAGSNVEWLYRCNLCEFDSIYVVLPPTGENLLLVKN